MKEEEQELGLDAAPGAAPAASAPGDRRDLSAAMVVVVVALAGALAVASASSRTIKHYMMRGERAPAIALEVLAQRPPPQGAASVPMPERASPRDHEGKVVLLDFWATWCPPCREQMPVIEKLHTDAALAESLAVFSINTDDPTPERARKVRAFMLRNKYTMPTLLDDGSGVLAFKVESIPTLVVLDPSGAIHHIHSGVHSEEELRAVIEEAKR